MSRSELHDAARKYAEAGWPVFPLIARDKRPATTNGFKDASTDFDQIDAWWGARPNLNIGLPTGIAFDVLDLDGEEAIAALRDFPGFPPNYRHTGPTSVTGKGFHLLWLPTGRGNGAALLGPDSKIDFRGAGGYIVAPPSIHPKGHQYTWAPARDPWTISLPEPTDWLTGVLDFRGVGEAGERALRPKVIPTDPHRKYLEQISQILPGQLPREVQRTMTRPDIIDVATAMGLPLWPKTRYVETICIFHEDHSPSLALYPDKNNFYCFACGAYGDSYDLQAREPMKR